MVMLPPKIVCSPAKNEPTMERERTTMPRTTPKFCAMSQPGNSSAVVTIFMSMRISLSFLRHADQPVWQPGGELRKNGNDGEAQHHHEEERHRGERDVVRVAAGHGLQHEDVEA